MANNGQRRRRDPNFAPEQLDVLMEEVSKKHSLLFGKETSREGKSDLWNDIADKVNQLDVKGFVRSGKQVKRKYIKYTSEMRLKELSHRSLVQDDVPEVEVNQISMDSHEDEERGDQDEDETSAATETITVTADNGGTLSFVDIINMAGVSNASGLHNHPVSMSCQTHEELEREKLSLKKIDLYMKMKKYHKNGFLTSTDVKLVSRWIRNPVCAPFKNPNLVASTFK